MQYCGTVRVTGAGLQWWWMRVQHQSRVAYLRALDSGIWAVHLCLFLHRQVDSSLWRAAARRCRVLPQSSTSSLPFPSISDIFLGRYGLPRIVCSYDRFAKRGRAASLPSSTIIVAPGNRRYFVKGPARMALDREHLGHFALLPPCKAPNTGDERPFSKSVCTNS